MEKVITRISKSQYLKGLQCPKALWFYRHRPDLYPEIPAARQHLFDSGHEVGKLAQKYFAGGIEITDAYDDIDQAISSTAQAVSEGCPAVFEAAACSADGAYSRIDILKQVENGRQWDLIEVKQSTRVKDYHLNDMALQRYAFEGAGYAVRKSILMHIDSAYIRSGDVDPKGLFALEDCTDMVLSRLPEVPGFLKGLLQVVNAETEPAVGIGDRCFHPFECEYAHHCWQHVPPYSVYNVLKGAQLQETLNNGILDVADMPDHITLTDRKAIDVAAWKDNTVHVDKQRIREYLNAFAYPLYYLDYETVFPAIPIYDSTSPYQQIPFQFSLHIQTHSGGDGVHIEFLHTEPSDPRPSFIQALLHHCGSRGTVVVYNQAFESRINRELGQAFPKYAASLAALNDRMKDLLIPFRSRYLYHPGMQGSASIKHVLPAFVPELNYDDLEISDGSTASMVYLACMKGTLSAAKKEILYQNLRKYCAMDTLAEVKLVETLYEFSK
jgi:hypothetical protein